MVVSHHGVVDDFFGDGIKANFGVPVPRLTEEEIRQDVVNAVQAGLAMIRELDQINQLHHQAEVHVGQSQGRYRDGVGCCRDRGRGRTRLKYTPPLEMW